PIPASLTLPGPGTRWSDAALFMLFAYAGFENMGVPAGEYKNPRRDLPMALLVGTLAIALLYALTQLAAMAVLPDLGTSQTPIADAAGVLLGRWGVVLVTVGALLSMMGTNSGTVLEGSRMLYALSIGRPAYGWLSRIHEGFRTPLFAIFVHVAIAIPMAIAGSFAKLALLSTVARMTTYLVTCAAVPRLAQRGDGGFRIPLAVAVLGIAISVLLFATLHWVNLVAALVALALGALLYLGGRRGAEAG